ncbi:hypothetical protein PFICI_06223 [Pestalotiopsis fici W106-1]|uniref:Uncharacterized protein n=1 Tax=Pestalotiopsis fici (strain W106-1 / CGMCC3.15140) TaxID=1229662 RepID=W3X7T9_PESFW|nr:uncharacterized protein PFICI_06223 [Pestalotiopsis fici W106-1]ETS81221.1 hypothetical protein PFICI_06223 [Pestalotiopsis fici W106-1]
MASIKASEGERSPCPDRLPDTPSSNDTLARSKRSITPRGPLFPNLDEAHRRITARAGPHNPFQKPTDEGYSSPDSVSQERLTDIAAPEFDNVDTPLQAHGQAPEIVVPQPLRLMAGRSLTKWQNTSKLPKNSAANNDEQISTENPDKRIAIDDPGRTDTTGSTVSRIVDQYAAAGDNYASSSVGSLDLAYTFEPRDGSRDSNHRSGQQDDERQMTRNVTSHSHRNSSCPPRQSFSRRAAETDGGSRVTEAQLPRPTEHDWLRGTNHSMSRPSDAYMHSPLPRIPVHSPLPQIPSRYALDDADDWQTEAEGGGDMPNPREPPPSFMAHQSLVPLPLRTTSDRNVLKVSTLQTTTNLSEPETSAGSGLGAVSTSSNGEPFPYDNEQFRRIRQLEKEREVSCALAELNESPTRTYGVVRRPAVSIEEEEFSNHNHTTIDEIEMDLDDNLRGSPSRHRHYDDGSFFDPIAFRALHGDIPLNEVKVVINKNPNNSASENNAHGSNFGLSFDRNDQRSRLTRSRDIDADWVTEATSEADFGINTSNRDFAEGIKATGSSIADYSDAGWSTPYPQFSSRNRVGQTISGEPESYEMQDLNERKQGGGGHLPKARVPRFDGFGQNNSRFIPNYSSQAGSSAGGQNPFRRDYKRADPGSYFQYKGDRNAPSRFEFRDSASTYTPAFEADRANSGTQGTIPSSTMASINTIELLDDSAGHSSTGGHVSSPYPRMEEGSYSDPHRHHPRHIPIQDPQQNPFRDGAHDQHQRRMRSATEDSEGMGSGSSKFSFKFLELPEAQERQRSRRGSNETWANSSMARDNRSISISSARPSLTPLIRPTPALIRGETHVRKGSRLSSTFTPPAWNTRDSPDMSNCTPLDASASRLTILEGSDVETPTAIATRRRLNQVPGGQSRMLPLDKRMRPNLVRPNSVLVRRDIPTFSAAEDYFVSSQGRLRSKIFFCVVVSLSILPFVTLLALYGKFDSCLASLTHGEVSRFNYTQRKILKIVFAVECIIYGAMVTAIIVYFVTLGKTHH